MTKGTHTKPFYNATIPCDWEDVEVRKVCDKFLNGGTPSTQVEEYWNGKIPWITGADIVEQRIPVVRKFISEKAVKESSTNVIPKGNLLLVTRTGVGKVTIAPFDVAISQDLTGLLLNGSLIDKEYAFYYFDGNENRLKNLNQGTSISGITRNVLEALKIPLPPLTEQKAIARVLSTWDEAIHKTEQLIAQKELRKKWLMQQLLTGKMSLKGFSGEWKEMHLGEMFTERNETKYFDLPLLSIGQNGVYPQDESIKKDTSNKDKSKYKRICPGDIGYNTMRMWQGRSALSQLEGIVSPAYTIVMPKKNADSVFFSYLFKIPKMTNLFWRNSQGLVDDTLNCKFKDFSIVKTILPQTKEEQTAIAQVLQTADKEISLLKGKAEKLREQKKGLMQQLLTGKKRLTNH